MPEKDTEITLGTGRLVGLFFGLVAICALFMGLGYTLGRNSAAQVPATAATSAPADPVTVVDASKPSGSQPLQVKTDAGTQPEDLSFYKSVEQNEADAKLAQPENRPESAPTPKSSSSGSGYMVQVAAVSKQEDAEALVAALKRKQYAVVIATNPPSDRLYHVQIGPFAEMKDAETIRTRLVGDGYNPIVKR